MVNLELSNDISCVFYKQKILTIHIPLGVSGHLGHGKKPFVNGKLLINIKAYI